MVHVSHSLFCTNGNGNVARNLVYQWQWVPDTKLLLPHTAAIHLLYVYKHIYIIFVHIMYLLIGLPWNGKRKIICKLFLGKGYVCFQDGILWYFNVCYTYLPVHHPVTWCLNFTILQFPRHAQYFTVTTLGCKGGNPRASAGNCTFIGSVPGTAMVAPVVPGTVGPQGLVANLGEKVGETPHLLWMLFLDLKVVFGVFFFRGGE